MVNAFRIVCGGHGRRTKSRANLKHPEFGSWGESALGSDETVEFQHPGRRGESLGRIHYTLGNISAELAAVWKDWGVPTFNEVMVAVAEQYQVDTIFFPSKDQ